MGVFSVSLEAMGVGSSGSSGATGKRLSRGQMQSGCSLGRLLVTHLTHSSRCGLLLSRMRAQDEDDKEARTGAEMEMGRGLYSH